MTPAEQNHDGDALVTVVCLRVRGQGVRRESGRAGARSAAAGRQWWDERATLEEPRDEATAIRAADIATTCKLLQNTADDTYQISVADAERCKNGACADRSAAREQCSLHSEWHTKLVAQQAAQAAQRVAEVAAQAETDALPVAVEVEAETEAEACDGPGAGAVPMDQVEEEERVAALEDEVESSSDEDEGPLLDEEEPPGSCGEDESSDDDDDEEGGE